MTDTPVTLSLYAMATRFEVVLHADDPVRLRAAGEEALREIERWDQQLSLYRADSDVSRINRSAARGPVRVDPLLFHLLRHCADLSTATDGTFDITVTPLLRVWGFINGPKRIPDPEELDSARAVVGMGHVRLNEQDFTVEFDREGVQIDLGAVGKGYAIERAAKVLREVGVKSALIHGGTSTVCGIGSPPDQDAWRVAIRDPVEGRPHLGIVDLRDSSLSVSAVHGKSFTVDGRTLGHVIDPRTGQPVHGTLAAAASGPSATDCDALSTALLVLGESGIPMLSERFPGYEFITSSHD